MANQTIVALVLSVIFGSLFRLLCPSTVNNYLINNLLGPIETLFLSSLTFIASPAIFISITCAILRFDGFTELNKGGKRVIFTYAITSCIAIFIGVCVFYLFKPGHFGIFPTQIGESSIGNLTILEMITDAIPPNIVAPFLSGNSLQLIVAALIIGLALNSSTKKVSGLKGIHFPPDTDRQEYLFSFDSAKIVISIGVYKFINVINISVKSVNMFGGFRNLLYICGMKI